MSAWEPKWVKGTIAKGVPAALIRALVLDDAEPSTREFVEFMLMDAHNRRENAGFAGAMDDGGASRIEGELECWLSGMRYATPARWDKQMREFNIAVDPEYETYQRLKQKFEKAK